MNSQQEVSASTVGRFVLFNIGIYIFYLVFIFFAGMNMLVFRAEMLSAWLLFLVGGVVLKNFLTYMALHFTKFMEQFDIDKSVITPFVFCDFFITLFLLKIFGSQDGLFGIIFIYVIMLSTTFSILTMKLFRIVRYMKKSDILRKVIYVFVKLFCCFVYFCIFLFCLRNVIQPLSNYSLFFGIFLLLVLLSITVFIENVISAGLYIYFRLIRSIDNEVKNKLLICYGFEILLFFVIFLILILNPDFGTAYYD